MNADAVQTLLQTTNNSVGQPIVYPRNADPEVTVLFIEMAPGEETGWHLHPVPLMGYILEGVLTVHLVTGEKRVIPTGGISLESVDILHNGVNEGAVPCKMVVFVAGLKDRAFTIEATSQQAAAVDSLPLSKTILPALVLAFITPILTELLSGNIQAPVFFLPWIYAFLIVIYGLPVLLIRELFVKWKLTLPGLFLLGLAYGIFNEGVCAKTLLLAEKVPINTFDHDTWLGINFPWAFLIVPWHALHAIIFPIALITWWFPAVARTSWLSSRVFGLAAILLLILGALIYVGNKKLVTSPLYLVLFLVVMAALIFLSHRTVRSGPFLGTALRKTLWPTGVGFTFYPVFVLGLSIAAGAKLPGIAICLIGILLLTVYYRLLVKRGWLALTPFVLFALGDYFSGALFTGLVMLAKGSLVGAITELMLIGAFGWGITRIHQHAPPGLV